MADVSPALLVISANCSDAWDCGEYRQCYHASRYSWVQEFADASGNPGASSLCLFYTRPGWLPERDANGTLTGATQGGFTTYGRMASISGAYVLYSLMFLVCIFRLTLFRKVFHVKGQDGAALRVCLYSVAATAIAGIFTRTIDILQTVPNLFVNAGSPVPIYDQTARIFPPSLVQADPVSLAVLTICTSCALLSVCLEWIAVAASAQRLSKDVRSRVRRTAWRIVGVSLALESLATILLLYFDATKPFAAASPVAWIIVLISVYVYGYSQVGSLQSHLAESQRLSVRSAVDAEEGSAGYGQRMQIAIDLMRTTARRLIVELVLLVTLFALVTVAPGGTPGGFNASILSYELAIWYIPVPLLTLVYYTTQVARRTGSSADAQPSGRAEVSDVSMTSSRQSTGKAGAGAVVVAAN